MSDFVCARCGGHEHRLAAPPMPGEMGSRAYQLVCAPCWQAWLQHQTALINHYALNVRDPEARKFLTAQAEAFLFQGSPSADA